MTIATGMNSERIQHEVEADKATEMNVTVSNLLDGTVLEYTYAEMGTVRSSYEKGCISFEWLAGPMLGQTGAGFPYRAREAGPNQFFVSWHEPELPGFVTLFVDFDAGRVHSSLIAGYGSENEQIHFDTASIDRVEREKHGTSSAS